MTRTVTFRKFLTLLWCKDLIVMSLYSAPKILEAGVQVLGKPNTKIKDFRCRAILCFGPLTNFALNIK